MADNLTALLAQATPAPWSVGYGRYPAKVRQDEARFASVSGPCSDPETYVRTPIALSDERQKPDTWAHDARLIALAPDAISLLVDMADALGESLQHPDHVSDEVRKERNRHALALLARFAALDERAGQ